MAPLLHRAAITIEFKVHRGGGNGTGGSGVCRPYYLYRFQRRRTLSCVV